MPNDLLIYELFDLQGLVNRGILRPLGGYRYQFTRDYLHSPVFRSPTKSWMTPIRASGIWRADSGAIISICDLGNTAIKEVPLPNQQCYSFQFERAVNAYTGGTLDNSAISESTAPSVDAGDDITVYSGATVYLEATGTSPQGYSLTYEWESLADVDIAIINSTQRIAYFEAPTVLVSTDLLIRVTVSDYYNEGTDTITVTVEP